VGGGVVPGSRFMLMGLNLQLSERSKTNFVSCSASFSQYFWDGYKRYVSVKTNINEIIT